MTCLQCHQLTCLSCRTVWHAGISCTQNIRNIKGPTAEQQKEEEASEALVAKTSKTCPNATCGARVDKVSGCDHMKCSRCGSQYCWECQADQEKIWSEGNSAHEKGCKHWRPAGDREGSPDVSDTSDDEDIDDAHDTDVEDARPLEPRERQRRGAMGGWHVGRNGAVGEQESQRPVPRTRMTREGVDEAVRVRAAHVARAAETVSPQSAIPESGRMMREQPLEAARMRANDLAWALETARNQASIPASVPTTQDQYQEEALQRIEALARVHQRRVENRAMRFHQAPEATSQYQDTHPSDRNPKTEADQEALQPARRRAPQVFDPVNRYQHNAERQARRTDYDRTQADVDEQQRVEQGLREFMKSSAEQRVQEEFGHNTSDRNTTTEADQEALQPTRRRGQQAANEIQRPPTFAQITDRHRAHADVHELERMSTQQWSELSLPDKTSLVEQRAQDIADQHTSATSPHQGYPQPPEGHPRQRQQEPTQQQTSTPAPAHQEQALVKRQPAMSFSATRQPPSGTTLAPPGFRFPHSPLQTPQLPMWALTPTPQHPKRETPIFPPGLPLFSPPRPAHLPPGPLFSNPFGSPPGPPFSNPFSSNPVPESYPSPTSPPSNPIRPPTPPHPLASASPKPPAPPTGTPESLAPLLRLQQTSDPARQWVWTLQAGHLILSEYPPTALVPPLAGVGRQLRARTVLGNDWATVRRLGATANGSGVERLVVEAWGGPGEEEEVHKWRRIGDNLPSKGRGRGGFYSFLGRERGREKE